MSNLLSPRYFVNFNLPFTTFKKGDILEAKLSHGEWVIHFVDYYSEDEASQHIDFFKEYPECFRELHWWEFRKESEMPEYLKIAIAKNEDEKGFIFKVERYEAYDVTDAEIPHESYLAYSSDIADCIPVIFCDPSTLEEYEQYIKSLK